MNIFICRQYRHCIHKPSVHATTITLNVDSNINIKIYMYTKKKIIHIFTKLKAHIYTYELPAIYIYLITKCDVIKNMKKKS